MTRSIRAAGEAGDLVRAFERASGAGRGGQRLGHDVDLPILFEGYVLKLRMKGDRQRGGQGPRRRRPDDGRNPFSRKANIDSLRRAGQPVADIHTGAGVHLIFNFRFGQCRAVVHAPENRLQALVDEAVLQEAKEGFDDLGFILRRHGGVGLIPAPENTQPLELRPLQVEVFLGVLAAGAAHRDGLHLQLLAAQLFVDFDLDGQAMAVPTGNIGGIEAGHGLRFHHEVLEALIERVSQVKRAVGVGWAVVQHVAGGVLAHARICS